MSLCLRVSLRIQSKCGKVRSRKTPNTYTFHAVIVEPFCVSVLVYFNSFCYSSVHAPESWKPLKYRSSRLEVFGVFKFHKTHGKATVSESLFNKVAGFRPASFLKQRSQHFFSIMQSFEEHLFYWVPPDDCFLKQTSPWS